MKINNSKRRLDILIWTVFLPLYIRRSLKELEELNETIPLNNNKVHKSYLHFKN